jgi:hypothetical protein
LEFHDDEFADGERDGVFDEHLLDAFGVADDDSNDGRICGALDADREHMNVAIVEDTDDIEERADAIGEEDGELGNAGTAELFRGLGGVKWHKFLSVAIDEGECCGGAFGEFNFDVVGATSGGGKSSGNGGGALVRKGGERLTQFIEEGNGDFFCGLGGPDSEPILISCVEIDLNDARFS